MMWLRKLLVVILFSVLGMLFSVSNSWAPIEIGPKKNINKITKKGDFSYKQCTTKQSKCNKMLRAVCDGPNFIYHSPTHPYSVYTKKLKSKGINCNIFIDYLNVQRTEFSNFLSELSDVNLCKKKYQTGRGENYNIIDIDLNLLNSLHRKEINKRNLDCDNLYASQWTDDYVCLMHDVNSKFFKEATNRGLNCKNLGNKTKEKSVNNSRIMTVNLKLDNVCSSFIDDDKFLISVVGTEMVFPFRNGNLKLRLKSNRILRLKTNSEISDYRYIGEYIKVKSNVILKPDCDLIIAGKENNEILDNIDKFHEQRLVLEEETRKEKYKRLEEERKRKELERKVAELEKKNRELSKPKKKEPIKPSANSGSGFFISKLGHIITNEHVVNN